MLSYPSGVTGVSTDRLVEIGPYFIVNNKNEFLLFDEVQLVWERDSLVVG